MSFQFAGDLLNHCIICSMKTYSKIQTICGKLLSDLIFSDESTYNLIDLGARLFASTTRTFLTETLVVGLGNIVNLGAARRHHNRQYNFKHLAKTLD